MAADKTGIGISVGNPTGLNAKYWLDSFSAIDAGFGWSFGRHTEASMHSDYLFHKKDALYFNENQPLDLYYGIGGRMEFADDIELGLRIPVGVAHEFGEQNADMFAELAPILNITPSSALELHLLVGARYYF